MIYNSQMTSSLSTVPGFINDNWLSEKLSRQVIIRQVVQIHEGYTSDVHRVVTDQGSYVIKSASCDTRASELATRFSAAEKESQFYRELAGQLQVNTPACYFAEQDPFILCLEDIGPADGSTALKEIDNRLELTVGVIGTLNRSMIQSDNKVQRWETMVRAAEPDMSALYLPAIELLPASTARDLLSHYAMNSISLIEVFSALPQVFSHMDFRPANFHLQGNDLVLFDWGDYGFAPAGFDLAYLLGTSLSPDARERAEEWILDFYYDELTRNSATSPSAAELRTGYALSFLPSFFLPALLLDRGIEVEEANRLALNLHAAIEHYKDQLVSII